MQSSVCLTERRAASEASTIGHGHLLDDAKFLAGALHLDLSQL